MISSKAALKILRVFWNGDSDPTLEKCNKWEVVQENHFLTFTSKVDARRQFVVDMDLWNISVNFNSNVFALKWNVPTFINILGQYEAR